MLSVDQSLFFQPPTDSQLMNFIANGRTASLGPESNISKESLKISNTQLFWNWDKKFFKNFQIQKPEAIFWLQKIR